MTPQTLRNYAAWGLVPKPQRKNLGRGGGVVALYPREAVVEALAGRELMRQFRASPQRVAAARRIALYVVERGYRSFREIGTDDQLAGLVRGKAWLTFLALEWLKLTGQAVALPRWGVGALMSVAEGDPREVKAVFDVAQYLGYLIAVYGVARLIIVAVGKDRTVAERIVAGLSAVILASTGWWLSTFQLATPK